MHYQPTPWGQWLICGIGTPPNRGEEVRAIAMSGHWMTSKIKRVISVTGQGDTATWIATIQVDPLTWALQELSRGICWLKEAAKPHPDPGDNAEGFTAVFNKAFGGGQ